MIYEGTAVSDGAAIGRVFQYEPYQPEIRHETIAKAQADSCMEKYKGVLIQAEEELKQLIEGSELDEEERKIFQAHIDIVQDEEMSREIEDEIRDNLLSPQWAIQEVYERYIKIISKAKDALIRERAADLKDVCQRLIRLWDGGHENPLSSLSGEVIVVARDLLPSDTAAMKTEYVKAIVTEVGGLYFTYGDPGQKLWNTSGSGCGRYYEKYRKRPEDSCRCEGWEGNHSSDG